MTLLYVDCSNNQWGGSEWTSEGNDRLLSFLESLRPAGIHGIVHKVSQGSDFQDPYWQTCREWCEHNDTSWLGYHYVSTDDPAAQVQRFAVNNGGPNVMLDWEQGSGDFSNFWPLVNAFNAAGVNVSLLYLPHWYWGDIGEPDLSGLDQIQLVSSAYPGGAGDPQQIYDWCGGDGGEGWGSYGGATPAVWQFTDHAVVDGIPVDCNAYKGDNLDVLFTS